MNGEKGSRVIAVVIILTLLAGLFVLGGTGIPFELSDDPETEELVTNWDEYVDQEVELGGTVVDADAKRIEVAPSQPLTPIETPGDAIVVTLEGIPDVDFEEGEEVSVAGIVRPDNTLSTDSDRIATRQHWETRYMYGISVGGVLLATFLLANYWRIEPRTLSVEPRRQPLVPIFGGDRRA